MFLNHGFGELRYGTSGDDSAAIHDGELVGEFTGEIQVLFHEKDAHLSLLPEQFDGVAYLVNHHWSAEAEGAIAWNDPDLAIDWPVSAADAVLADKDRAAGGFKTFVSPF